MKKKKKGPAQIYLERIRSIDYQIEGLLVEKESLEDTLLRVTPTMSAVSGSSGGGNQDKLGSTVARIVDMEARIDRAVDDLINLKNEASTLLARLEVPEHYRVLHERYIQYKSFEQIAAGMNYSYRNVHYKHGRALQAFGKVLEEYRKERNKTPLE